MVDLVSRRNVCFLALQLTSDFEEKGYKGIVLYSAPFYDPYSVPKQQIVFLPATTKPMTMEARSIVLLGTLDSKKVHVIFA